MISYSETEETLIVSFQGSLDTANCLSFDEELMEKIKDVGKAVEFDLTEVDYIASMFLRICTKTAKEVGKEKFSVSNVSESLTKIFALTKLDKILKVTTS